MLDKYRKKRDFSRTPEPPGKKASEGGSLAFMVHKHHASHLHYDLRLELDGVLKSWAVPKGPSMDPDDKRLAMMVEDHPFEYGDFEGVIPEGQYGAWPTLIWDAGTYSPAPDQGSKEANEGLLRKKLEKGHVNLVFHGEKLQGEFSLIRIPQKDGKDNAWLFRKSDDEFANAEFENAERSVVSGLTIEQLREGADGKESPMPESVEPMLATLADAPFDREGWVFEIKWDGYRALAQVKKGKVRLYSRNGISFNDRFPTVVTELSGYRDALFDGEIVAFDEKGRSDFWLLQEFIKTGEGTVEYCVFDLLHHDGRDLSGLPLLKRKELLKKALKESPHVRYSDHVENSGKAFFELAKDRGLEGVIAKRSDSPYRFGRRSNDWLKIKNVRTQEAVICGYTEPRWSRKGIGALVLGTFENEKWTYVGHAGGGFDSEGLLDMKKRLDRIRADCPFEKVPKTNEKATWVKPKLVCEVKFQEWTKDGLMRQPVFLGIREDKRPEEVSREKETPVAGLPKIPFTHLDKVYFPEDGITKGDLVDYYSRIAPFILPYLRGRPQTLVRYPNGINEEGFYQKNFKTEDLPPWICTEDVRSESEDRTLHYAVVCKDEASLLYLVNLGCIELHPWSSRVGSLENPDYVIFDLDPEDIEFSAVVEAAEKTWSLLDSIGAPCFCKTSWATGIHLFVPTGTKYDYDQAVAFAKLVNTLVHAELPDTTSLERSPKKRQKRVYLDYLQNRRGQTIASAYSVRPRKGAPVSVPIKREELNGKLRSDLCDIRSVFDRLEKVGDVWKGFFEAELDMEKCLAKIEEKLR